MLLIQFKESRASSTQSIEGVLIVSPLKIPSATFMLLANLNIFGIGQLGWWVDSLSMAFGDSAIIP